jgi:hypothetical protein
VEIWSDERTQTGNFQTEKGMGRRVIATAGLFWQDRGQIRRNMNGSEFEAEIR